MQPPRSLIALTCYVRPSSFVEPIDETIQRVRAFESSGVVDDVHVEAWPDEIVLESAGVESEIVDRYDTFRRWADRCGVSLRPAFAVRERGTLVSEGTQKVLVLPVVCLAISVDGELASVVPHVDGETTYTVNDALADIEALDPGGEPAAVRTAAERPAPGWATRPDWHCPACGAELLNGQGLYTCPTCPWVGITPTNTGRTMRVTDAGETNPVDEPNVDESDGAEPRGHDEREASPST